MFEIPKNLDTILHIGAGQAEELPAYLESHATRILLVEPNPKLAERLRQRTQDEERVEIVERAITDNLDLDHLTEYNLPEAASLYQPTGLLEFFPGLRVTARHSVRTSTLRQLLERYPLGKGNNLLVLQTPGAELAIVKAMAFTGKVEPFSHLWLTCPHEAFYNTGSHSSKVLSELKRQGYEVYAEGADHDDWPQWQIACNPLALKVQALELEKQALADALKQSKNELEQTKRWLAAREKRIDKLTQEKELDQKAHKEALNATVALDDLHVVRDDLKSFFRRKIETATQQVESTLGMQNYFQTGSLPISYHGWPISPDLALYLVQLLETNRYDLIVEFGSGSSTLLFARCIYNQYCSRSTGLQRGEQRPEVGGAGHKWLLPSDRDLPRRVVAFEHKKEFFDLTLQMLKEEGAEDVVDLVYSPLVDYSHQGENYLYYDCLDKFSGLKQMVMTDSLKVLALVDGPPKSTGENARFPALPIMLNALSRCSFDVLLDDSDRPEEKVVAEKWQHLLKARGISYKKTNLKFEKGAIHFSIGTN